MPTYRRKASKRLLARAFQFIYWNLACLYRRLIVPRTRVVGLTGSFGKSTTAGALVSALDCREHRKLIYNAGRMVARSVFKIRPGDRYRVIEVGIEGPDQMAAYAGLIRPDIAVVTAIGSEHHLSFGTLERTRDEKAHMLRVLKPEGLAVLNGDDPNVLWMATQTRARIVFYGVGPDNGVRAENIRRDDEGRLLFTLCLGGKHHEVRSKFFGRHQIYSLLAAAAVANEEHIPYANIVAGLEAARPQEQRLNTIRLESGVTILSDEAKSSFETIETALDTLAEMPAQRRIVVLGEISEPPGSQGPLYRELGRRFAGFIDFGVHVGRMHRRYAAESERAGLPRDRFVNADTSVIRAAELLRAELRPGDLVLIKGRDNQKLQRVTLQLMGREVRCDIYRCDIKKIECDVCPMLNRATVKSDAESGAEATEAAP